MINFRTRQRRSLWFWLVIGYLFDVVIAYFVLQLLGSTWPFYAAFLIILAIGAALAVFGLYSSLKKLAIFLSFGRKAQTKALAEEMRKAGLPIPDENYENPAQYFEEALVSNETPREAKILAAIALFQSLYESQRGHIIDGIITSMTYEDALEEYKRTTA